MEAPALVRPLHVFIVENHEDTLKWLSLYIEDLGYAVTGVRSMAAALEKLAESEIDVLISDIGLTDGDGWQLLRNAKLPAHVYTIAMSGFGMNADRVRSREAGYRQHLLKPFDPDELDQMLEEAAKAKESRT